MQTRKNRIGLTGFIMLALLFNVFFVFSAKAAATGGPVGLLQNVADQMISNLQQHKITLHSNRQYVYSLAYRLVVPHVDVIEMSRRVISPQVWGSATPSQKATFQNEFITMLVHTYASALASYTDQTVQFYPLRSGEEAQHTVEVNSQITSASGAPPVNVKYRLVHEKSGWKLYDMSVEGISVIESFRSQFADVLEQGNMNTLINRLSQHNANPSSGE